MGIEDHDPIDQIRLLYNKFDQLTVGDVEKYTIHLSTQEIESCFNHLLDMGEVELVARDEQPHAFAATEAMIDPRSNPTPKETTYTDY